MSQTQWKRTTGWLALGLGVLVLALLVMNQAPAAKAQSDLGEATSDDQVGITAPDPINEGDVLIFCDGDVCPGQTCDEINDRCVGNVTLQPCLGKPLVGLTADEQTRFDLGRIAFDMDFDADEGLGPVFNQDACGSCHSNPQGGSGTIKVVRFGFVDPTTQEFDPLADLGGSLLNEQSISPECAEQIPFDDFNVFSFRLTNSILGAGLVEAIPEADILANEFTPPAGVSGRAHVVPVLESPGETAVGRFGWKSQLATVLSFSADAFLQEMGITTRIFPHDNAPNANEALLAQCDTVADPEDQPDNLGVDLLDRVTDFQRFLAPPPQTPRSGMTGEAIFFDIGCESCHLSSFTTADEDSDDELEDAIAGKELYPYSDFLLHDMGSTADGIAQGDAERFEIRTPPIWGLRVRDPLWHNGLIGGGTFEGRILDVIDLHNAPGSEAEASAQAFLALSTEDQNAVIDFLDSLGRCEFDHDGDGDVDDDDFAVFEGCFTGQGVFLTPDDHCSISDADQDGDVDDDDLELILAAMGIPTDDDEDEDEDEDEDADFGGNGEFQIIFDQGNGTLDLTYGGSDSESTHTSDSGVAGDESDRDRGSRRSSSRSGQERDR